MCSDRSLRAASLVACLALGVALSACGKQGDPHPRPRAVPQPAKDLALRQRGNEFLLEFSYPSATVAGMPLERLAAAIVYEATAPALAGGKAPTLRDTELEALAKPVLELSGAALDEAVVGGKISVRREVPPAAIATGEVHLFAVRTKSQAGLLSPFSNVVGLKPLAAPPSPGALEVTAKARGVELRWSAPVGTTPLVAPVAPVVAAPAPATPAAAATTPPTTPPTSVPAAPSAAPPASPAASPAVSPSGATSALLPIAGYVVLRREATSPNWSAPLATLAPTVLEHLDKSARYGTRYVYTVLTLVQADPPIESAPQSAREVDYRDLFAPTPPTELRALLVGDAVRLVWEPSPEADLAGYWIERAEAGGEFRRVNPTLVTGTDYSDPLPAGGGALSYRLLAVDAVGNLAAPTAPVTVERP